MEGGVIRYAGTASELRDRPDLLHSAYLLRGSSPAAASGQAAAPAQAAATGTAAPGKATAPGTPPSASG
jgi:hypothetical protein